VTEQAGLGFGGLLRQLRDDAGLTQEEMAEAARVSQRAVSDLERGVNRTARKDTALLLAGALGLDGRARELFVAAARGRVSAGDVLAVVAAKPPGVSAALAWVPASNFPAQLASFIGRDRELAEVRALMESGRLVTLTGAGGSGKTRLGLQVAAALPGGWGDGVWLVELAAVTDQASVPAAVSRVLGIAGQPGRPALDTLLDALAPQDVLIVLDNCEHLIGGCATAAAAIVTRCPGVRLLATSREPLGIGGEAVYRVPPLSLPAPGEVGSAAAWSCDAVALFADRARGAGRELSIDAQTGPLVVSICRRLDGLPLAIELAAARLRSLSLIDLNDRLDQRFRLLTGGSRTAPARQQTLQATVEWSYSMLSGDEQMLLRRLSVFAEGFGLDAAEAVCSFGGFLAPDVTDLLGSLVDKNLVMAESAGPSLRYGLLETIRQFAAERLAESGEGEILAAAAAHCAYFLSVAEAVAPNLTGPDQGSWLARLDTDQANLRRAADYAAARPDDTVRVLRFGTALRRYWQARARYAEALGLLVPVLRRPDARSDLELFGAALVAAAHAASLSDVAAALPLGEQGLELARQLDNDRLLIEFLTILSVAHYFEGQPDKALLLGQEAVERARPFGDDVLLGRSLMGYLMSGSLLDPAHSGQLFAEAIACTGRSGDQLMRYHLFDNAGFYALCAGDIDVARAHLEQAARISRSIGYVSHTLSVNLGWLLRQENNPHGARSMFEASLQLGRRTGSQSTLAHAILGLACLAADQDDWHRAAELHGAAQALLDRTERRWEEEGEAHFRRDSLDHVRAHLGKEQFGRAYAKGTTLSLEEALDLALG
jgi:predicted ATPase/DNA-binding XRE family transcriptional regulator